MTFKSVDEVQNLLAETIFAHAKDRRKAAGRALGTIVELITFYVFKHWGFLNSLSIERRLPEFGNPGITHNVEFGLHPVLRSIEITFPRTLAAKGISRSTLRKVPAFLQFISDFPADALQDRKLLSSGRLQRNACTLGETNDHLLVGNLVGETAGDYQVQVSILAKSPFAMAECKRVGIELSAKRGPTTIEKAKQGAYVAKHVTALQKVRAYDGTQYGVLPKPGGGFDIRPWKEELHRLVNVAPPEELSGFVMTIGIASNHGNWFTSNNANKELRVLMQSYDWLLFLTDAGIMSFLRDTALSSDPLFESVRKAFADSYGRDENGDRLNAENCITKVNIARDAHLALDGYFAGNLNSIERNWFNILSPEGERIELLKEELGILRGRKWAGI